MVCFVVWFCSVVITLKVSLEKKNKTKIDVPSCKPGLSYFRYIVLCGFRGCINKITSVTYKSLGYRTLSEDLNIVFISLVNIMLHQL